jgi:hypothetical protein
VRDIFAESGPYAEVIKKYGMSAEHIAQAVQEVVARKNVKGAIFRGSYC